jgi:hypothetical protein
MTLAELRALLRTTMTSPDAAQWPDTTLDLWIGEAIRMYSARFPRRLRDTLTLTTGTQAYALPGGSGFQGILSVAYPAADDPPPFLQQVSEMSALFQAQGYAYALRGVTDTTTAPLDTTAGSIVFAQDVTTGETAAIEYLAAHSRPAVGADTAQITVPEAHMEAIRAAVEWLALDKLANEAAWKDCLSNDKLAQLQAAADTAKAHHTTTLDGLAPILPVGGPTPVYAGNVANSWGSIGL